MPPQCLYWLGLTNGFACYFFAYCLFNKDTLIFFYYSNLPLSEVNADGQELEESIGKGINQFW